MSSSYQPVSDLMKRLDRPRANQFKPKFMQMIEEAQNKNRMLGSSSTSSKGTKICTIDAFMKFRQNGGMLEGCDPKLEVNKYNLALFIPGDWDYLGGDLKCDLRILVNKSMFEWEFIEGALNWSKRIDGIPTIGICPNFMQGSTVLDYIQITLDKNFTALTGEQVVEFYKLADYFGDLKNLEEIKKRIGPTACPETLVFMLTIGGFDLDIRRTLLESFIKGHPGWIVVARNLKELFLEELIDFLNDNAKGLDKMNLEIVSCWATSGDHSRPYDLVRIVKKVRHLKIDDHDLIKNTMSKFQTWLAHEDLEKVKNKLKKGHSDKKRKGPSQHAPPKRIFLSDRNFLDYNVKSEIEEELGEVDHDEILRHLDLLE